MGYSVIFDDFGHFVLHQVPVYILYSELVGSVDWFTDL